MTLLASGDFYQNVANLKLKDLVKLRNLGQLCHKSAVDCQMFTFNISMTRQFYEKFSLSSCQMPELPILSRFENPITTFGTEERFTIWVIGSVYPSSFGHSFINCFLEITYY